MRLPGVSEISESVVSLAEGDFLWGSLEDIAVMGFYGSGGGFREGGWMLLNRVRSGLSVGEETAGCQGASVVAPGGVGRKVDVFGDGICFDSRWLRSRRGWGEELYCEVQFKNRNA